MGAVNAFVPEVLKNSLVNEGRWMVFGCGGQVVSGFNWGTGRKMERYPFVELMILRMLGLIEKVDFHIKTSPRFPATPCHRLGLGLIPHPQCPSAESGELSFNLN